MTVLRGTIARVADRTLAWLMPPIPLRWRRPRPVPSRAPGSRSAAQSLVTHTTTLLTRHTHVYAAFRQATILRDVTLTGSAARSPAARQTDDRRVTLHHLHTYAHAPWPPGRAGGAGAGNAMRPPHVPRAFAIARRPAPGVQPASAAAFTRRLPVGTAALPSRRAAARAFKIFGGEDVESPRRGGARRGSATDAVRVRSGRRASIPVERVDEERGAPPPARMSTLRRRTRRSDVAVDASPAARTAAHAVVPLVWRASGAATARADRPGPEGQRSTGKNAESAAAIAVESRAAEAALRAVAADRRTAPLTLGPAEIDRLAEDVIRRIERRARIERERYGK